jgi:hypothetical protein
MEECFIIYRELPILVHVLFTITPDLFNKNNTQKNLTCWVSKEELTTGSQIDGSIFVLLESSAGVVWLKVDRTVSGVV